MAAAIFWMKARAGWREKHEITVATDPLRQLSDAELEQMIDVLQQAIIEQSAIGTGGTGMASPNGEQSGVGRYVALIEAE